MRESQKTSWLQTILNRIVSAVDALLAPLIAVITGLVIGAVLMQLIGVNPLEAYQALWSGVAGGKYQIGIVLVKATPLIIAGLGLSLAFRCGVFNIGGEGQIYIGALAGTWVGIQNWGLPQPVHIGLALLAGFIGGGLWAAFAGYLRARYQINEIITTILLNYIAIFLVSYFTHGPMRDNPGAAASLPHTPEVLITSRLPLIWQGTRLHAGFIVALVLAVVIYFIIFHTSFGFKARAVGFSATAARYAGMHVVWVVVLAMFISGGLAGIAGTTEILGVQRRLRDMFSPGTGYTAIAIALVGKNHPLGVILAGLLFGALEAGANNMEALAGVPSTIVSVIQAVVIFLVAISVAWRNQPLRDWLRNRLANAAKESTNE
jgi:general nucleoside transport system permease protein